MNNNVKFPSNWFNNNTFLKSFKKYYTINKNIIPENIRNTLNLPNINENKKSYIQSHLTKYNNIIKKIKQIDNPLSPYADEFRFNVFF
jgi:hypothetical protein